MTDFAQVRYDWFDDLASLLASIPANSFCITDANVADALGLVGESILVVPPGEASKTCRTWEILLRQIAERGATRSTAIVAIGGGMVGDLAGFVAATYMRGVPFLQVPTTLLAMVDSSVGGKVAINLPQGKNLVGAFYHPDRVLFCEQALTTLPEREWRSGMAEVLKYGFICDRELLARASESDRFSIREIIQRCVDHKRRIVAEDEKETSDVRATLNFGHTIGHALEAETGFGSALLHGEAIAIGMVVETRLAERLGIAQRGFAEVVRSPLVAQGLPTDHPYLRERTDALMNRMRRDKKATATGITFALVPELGTCRIVREVDEAAIRLALIDAAGADR